MTEAKPVAWMHPTAGWCDSDKSVVAPHCLNDGPEPLPLFSQADYLSALSEAAALKEEVGRLKQGQAELLKDFVAREDKAWMPFRAFRTEYQVELDEARHEVLIEATDMVRKTLGSTS